MQLKKAQREKYKDLIRTSDGKKLLTIGETRELKFAWGELSYEHYLKLRRDLQQISGRKLADKLEADVLQDGTRIFDTGSYFKRYSDAELTRIAGEIQKTQAALLYLQALAAEEKDRRKRGKG